MPHVDPYFKGSTQPLEISRASGFEPRTHWSRVPIPTTRPRTVQCEHEGIFNSLNMSCITEHLKKIDIYHKAGFADIVLLLCCTIL